MKCILAMAAIVAGLLPAAPARAQVPPLSPDRPVVTIPTFDTRRTGWVPPPGFGDTLAERLGERLVESGKFRVLDAAFLGSEDADIPLRTLAEHAGAKYLVLGTLSSYSKEEKKRSGGGATAILGAIIGARLRMPMPIAAGGAATTIEAMLVASVRVVDVQTGEVVIAVEGRGKASRTNRTIGGFGVASAPVAGGFSNSSRGGAEAMLDEAARDALDEAGFALAEAAVRLRGGASR